MNTNMTTKSWTTSQQANPFKSDNAKKMSAENPFGDKDIGQVLNQIADPNWIDPSKKVRESKENLDKDAFFKLMLAQMKNQDPMNPMQSHEMAAQLAQFTSVEQLQNVNSNLEGIKKQDAPLADYQALQFIGKEISADSSSIVRAKSDEKHDLRFNLQSEADDINVKIFDADGQLVKTLALKNMKKGLNSTSWNGYNDQGLKTLAGDYKFTVEAKDLKGKIVGSTTDITGRISGLQYTSKGPVLMIGDQTVYLSDVKKIVDPKLKAEADEKSDATSQAPVAMAATKTEEQKPMSAGMKGLIQSQTPARGATKL